MSYIRKEELIRRMQISAPMNWTDTDFELGEEAQYDSDMKVVESCAEIKVIPIPPRATNGDMIKALFPNIVVETVKLDGQIIGYDICNMDTGTYAETYFTEDWWNAPYNPQQNLSYTDKSGANIASQDVLRSAT